MNKLRYCFGVLFLLFSWQAEAVSALQMNNIYDKIVQINHLQKLPLAIVLYIETPTGKSYLNAQNRGDIIFVTRQLLKSTNKNEIALILGHELAHGTLHHVMSTIPNEYAADKLGFKYAINAGFDGCKGAKYFLQFGGSSDHPAGIRRYNKLCSKTNPLSIQETVYYSIIDVFDAYD